MQERENRADELPEREREVADEVLQGAGAIASVWIPKEFSVDFAEGFHDLEIRIKSQLMILSALSEIEKQLGTSSVNAMLKEHQVSELIDIRYKRKVTKKKKKISRELVLHSEIVDGGENEPAMSITYTHALKRDYRDRTGSSPKYFWLELVLPESTAKEVERIIDKNPAFIRVITEQAMKEKLLENPQAWETPVGKCDPLRPPWEKWDAEPNGRRVYIQKEGSKPGWHEEFVHEIKK